MDNFMRANTHIDENHRPERAWAWKSQSQVQVSSVLEKTFDTDKGKGDRLT